MSAVKILLPFVFLISFVNNSFSQSQDKAYAIQLAAYKSWDQFAENKSNFITHFNKIDFPSSAFNENDIYVEKTAKWIKVYLIKDEFQSLKVLMAIKGSPYFANSFRSNKLDLASLYKYKTAYDIHEKRPEAFAVKGGRIAAPTKVEKYKIQLGVFNEEKSLTDLANKFGVKIYDQQSFIKGISHDFVRVKNKVHRRYYYGGFSNKTEAETEKKQLEKECGKQFLVVKH